MIQADVCSADIVNVEKVNHVASRLPGEEENLLMAELFKALGDPTRLRIVQALALEELCVCDLTALMDISISAISHQLRLLRNLKVVKFRRAGKMAYYSLDDDCVQELITLTRKHVTEK